MKPLRQRTIIALFTLSLSAAWAQTEQVDLAVVHKIREEALQNGKVMDHAFQLTDVVGPRLTNSPGFFAAADWIVEQMTEWGIDAKEEAWGPFGNGWNYTRFSANMIEPTYAPLIGFPMAWSPGTDGVTTGNVVIVNITDKDDFKRYEGALKDKIVFFGTGRPLEVSTEPLGKRYSEQELANLVNAPTAGRPEGTPGAKALRAFEKKLDGEEEKDGEEAGPGAPGGRAAREKFQNELNEFLVKEGVAVVVRNGRGNSEGGTVFAQSAGPREADRPLPPPTIALTPEHYNRVLRLLDNEVPVQLSIDVDAQILTDRTDSVNVVAEIPGRTKPDEIVMIGAHLDSWHGGTGATDNAAGSAVMIEVMRILKELDLPMDRTVRMALWGGEEQGLLGSRAYVDEHFANREDMVLKPEHEKLSGYFNVDNGTGKIRGVYLQGNDRMRPIFEAWFEPFADLGAGAISIRNTGGTDHQNFDAVGLPGFQFIQDSIEYQTRTHHSNMDVYDRLQRADLEQMAAIVASFVYNAATRPDLLPREPLPEPQPKEE